MSETHQQHSGAHSHQHGPNCGHTALKHNGHTHYPHDGHVDDHRIEVNSVNPEKCTPDRKCSGHEKTHIHGPNCGLEAVPHGNHVDYLVGGHLHHFHGTHCDDHGTLEVAVGTSSRGAA